MGKHSFKLDKFPFEQVLSLEKLLEYWIGKSNSQDPFEKEFATIIVEKAKKVPKLFTESPSASLTDKNSNLLTHMVGALASPLRENSDIWGISSPMKFEFILTTKKMDELFGKRAKSLSKIFFDSIYGENYYGPTIHTYGRILKEFYNADMSFDIPVYSFDKLDEKLKIERHYEINTNADYNKIIPVKPLKKLSDQQIKNLCDNFYDVELLLKTIPPENFEIHGFTVSNIIESTEKQSISSIKNKLLEKDAIVSKEHFGELERKVQSLMKLHDLKIGVAVFSAESKRFRDFMSTWQTLLPQPELICDNYTGSLYEKAKESNAPIIINDLESLKKKTALEESLLKAGFNSYIVIPLYFEDSIVGVLEMGSPNKNDLNQLSMIKFHEVIPLFAIAAARVNNDLNSQIKAKIQEEFTAIHPVVEWKFSDAASNLLREEKGEAAIEKEPIIFNDVYPLFGATDIRSSSQERNKAIRNDLAEQLKTAKSILKKAHDLKPLPVLEQVQYEISEHLRSLKKGMLSGDETRIIDFLRFEVEPILLHLKDSLPEIGDLVGSYESTIDPEHGILYKQRHDFEESIGMINDAISSVLDEQEESAQLMFPHYFEKYRTDGIEYNIYMGQSILERLKFDPVYLKNLRLWQLIVMCQIARKAAEIKISLPLPLDITQLVLVHSKPLSIRFREDEKKFDVEGGYNIRYEITKKRIDKAVIKKTGERLTQPGYLAIIYTQPDEYVEYSKYLDYLASINYIEGKVEKLSLEDLQGVYGLQAVRVKININGEDPQDLANMKKIADEAKNIVL